MATNGSPQMNCRGGYLLGPWQGAGGFTYIMPQPPPEREFHFQDELETRGELEAWPKLSLSLFYYFVITDT